MYKHGAIIGLCYLQLLAHVQAWGNHWSLLSSIAGPCPSMGQSLVFAIFECWTHSGGSGDPHGAGAPGPLTGGPGPPGGGGGAHGAGT